LVLAVAIVAGCASTGARLVPGKSTAADVEREMGRPAERIGLKGGESVWFYPRGSAARQTFAVRLGADGVVREVSQVRTMQNLAKLESGKSTVDDVQQLLGPPDRITTNPRIQRTVWQYNMFEDTRAVIVYVQLDPAGKVREVFQTDDPAFVSPAAGW
jgi:hypothetical protein